MPKGPAPLDELKVKLCSPTPAVREVALIHTQAHGPAGIGLAADVARLLDDEHPAVQLQAVHTFRAIGAGAADAVPVLLNLRSKSGAAPMLVTRATFLLGVVGKAADSAVPALKEDLAKPALLKDALGALLEIAPSDPQVASTLVDAAFSPDYALSSLARDAVKTASPGLIDQLVEAVVRHAAGDPERRVAAIQLAITLAEHRPSPLVPIILRALSRLGTKEVRPAVGAAGKLPKPLPDDVVRSLVLVARSDDPAAEPALSVLATLEDPGGELQGVFRETIRRNKDASPVGGPAGGPARSLAVAAGALTQAAAEEALPELLTWVNTALEQIRPELSWDTLARVLSAVARLAPGSEEVHAAIRDAAEIAFSVRDQDESGVVDFERAIRRISNVIADEVLWKELEDKGLAREDSDEDAFSEGTEDSGAISLPAFPPETGPLPKPTSRTLTRRERDELDQAVAMGRALIGVPAATEPKRIAEAVEQLVRRWRREKGGGEDHLLPLAGAYGDAVARATGWTWEMFQLAGAEQLALVSKTKAHVHLPVAYISEQVRGARETTVLLLFNMLVGGSLPPAAAGALSAIG